MLWRWLLFKPEGETFSFPFFLLHKKLKEALLISVTLLLRLTGVDWGLPCHCDLIPAWPPSPKIHWKSYDKSKYKITRMIIDNYIHHSKKKQPWNECFAWLCFKFYLYTNYKYHLRTTLIKYMYMENFFDSLKFEWIIMT